MSTVSESLLQLEVLVVDCQAAAAAPHGHLLEKGRTTVVWREPGDSCARLIVIEEGEVALSAAADAHALPPIPPGYRRPVAARREAFTLASFDRLRVLTTELKRLIAVGAPVALRLGVGPALDESRLASALWWV